ncbi:hypothetical protein QCE63_35695 [Caballeronia sp. LZ065]|uniref:hypothetical protein n=1 Tax=Caballeronia sp. LZ065 TaxID=3038571 RepID=UPI002856EF36|nr:hypothetical protein [Caballeronia sp. LZ065]MDR5784736.1 hypothetical protein [Caballeronia sp. LZ065]
MNKALIALLTLLGTSLAHAQTSPAAVAPSAPSAPTMPPNVLDAAGHTVGALSHFQYNHGPLVTRGNTRFVAPLKRKTTTDDPSGIKAPSSASLFLYHSVDSLLYYTSADCSGDPIVTASKGPTPAVVVREGTTVTAYVASNTASSQSFSIASQRSTQTESCTPLSTPTQRTGWPLGSKIVLTREHPEPLTVSY